MDSRNREYTEEELERMRLLRERLRDPDSEKMFRTAYTFKMGPNYSSLKPYCEDVVLAIDGYGENIINTRSKLELALMDYDSDKDLIVPVGRAPDNMLVGMIVMEKVLQKPKANQSYAVAVYQDYAYKFYQIYVDPTMETHLIPT